MTVPQENRELHCPVCTVPQTLISGKVHTCDHCGAKDRRLAAGSTFLSFIFSLTALIFYIPANFLPFMTIELYGTRQSSTILSGIVSLLNEQSYLIGLIVFLASVLIPVLKLLILLYLTFPGNSHYRSRFKMSLYLFVESIGRWSMLDIFLLAVLVAMVKLGKITTVQPEIGSTMFALVVIFTLLASNSFDPRILWEKKNAALAK